MAIIKKLSDKVIGIINAGEVISRPSEIVKECIENSLDADSDNISIYISNAGKESIIVKDDGFGMLLDDLQLAVLNHTTSKLSNENIQDVLSYGFRGEALSSMASVSELSVASRNIKEENGWIISVNNGVISEYKPSSIKSGTIVECRNLFARHPVRLKFLKSNHYENQIIKNIVKKYSLAKPEIGFKLFLDNQIIYDFPMENLETRISKIFPQEFKKNAYQLSINNDFCSIRGYLGLPTWDENSKHDLYIFVNGRPVQNRDVIETIRGYYKELGTNNLPCGFINFYVDPYSLDINIHPTKNEIKFVDQKEIIKTLREGIKNSLGTMGTLASSALSLKALTMAKLVDKDFLENWTHKPLGKPIGLILDSFLITETQNSMYLIDFHAAHERIINEKLKASIKNNNLQKFIFLNPILIEVGFKNIAFFEDNKILLSQLGFSYDIFDNHSLIFNEIPEYLVGIDLFTLVNEFIKAFNDNVYSLPLEEFINYMSGELSCHVAKKSGDLLTIEEMEILIKEIETTPNSFICNHGRPTVLEIEKNSLLKLFKRK